MTRRGRDGVIALPEIGVDLGMAELYEDVAFSEPLAGGGGLG